MGVITDSGDGVAQIILDWPDVRNALGPSEAQELMRAFQSAQEDDRIGAVLLRANGPAFCAGGNLREIVALAEQGADAVKASVYSVFQGLFRTIAACPVPIVAAVDGPAVGFGCDLALAADMTFVGAKGWLAQGWANAGLIPATGGALHAKRRGGVQAVWGLMASSRLAAGEAQALGLAVAAPNAQAAGWDATRALAALPRAQVRATKRLLALDDPNEHLAKALEYQVSFLTSTEFLDRARHILSR